MTFLELMIFSAVTIWLVVLGWYEYYERRLPNALTVGGALVFLALHLLLGGLVGLLNALLGGLIGFLFLLIPFLKNGAGAGDVKMLTAVGCYAGFPLVFDVLMLCSIFGFLMGAWMILTKKVGFARMRHWMKCCFWPRYDKEEGRKALPSKMEEPLKIPFGLAISLGSWLSIVYALCNKGT